MDIVEEGSLLDEATLHVMDMSYSKSKNDPKPRVIVLGRFKHPRTGNTLVCGINAHYISKLPKGDAKHFKEALIKISDDSLNTKQKYNLGLQLLPNIFRDAYRTYDEQYITGIKVKDIDIKDGSVKIITVPDTKLDIEPELPKPEKDGKPPESDSLRAKVLSGPVAIKTVTEPIVAQNDLPKTPKAPITPTEPEPIAQEDAEIDDLADSINKEIGSNKDMLSNKINKTIKVNKIIKKELNTALPNKLDKSKINKIIDKKL